MITGDPMPHISYEQAPGEGEIRGICSWCPQDRWTFPRDSIRKVMSDHVKAGQHRTLVATEDELPGEPAEPEGVRDSPEGTRLLRELAQAATPGPWDAFGPHCIRGDWTEEDGFLSYVVLDEPRDTRAGHAGVMEQADTDYIAGWNPQAALAVLDEYDRMVEVLAMEQENRRASEEQIAKMSTNLTEARDETDRLRAVVQERNQTILRARRVTDEAHERLGNAVASIPLMGAAAGVFPDR